MSENNYGALMMKQSVLASENINLILNPGIYPVSSGNNSSPDANGGILLIHAGLPVRRSFISDATILITSTYNSTTSSWGDWVRPLSRKDPFADIKADGTAPTGRNNLGLGTAATRDVGADNASKLLDLDSFRSMMSGNGYIYIPCIATTGNPVKLMLQWGTVATQKGADAGYALPFAFPYAGLFATGNRGTSGYNAAMNVRIASRTHISVQNWAPSGEGVEDCCFIALGY